MVPDGNALPSSFLISNTETLFSVFVTTDKTALPQRAIVAAENRLAHGRE